MAGKIMPTPDTGHPGGPLPTAERATRSNVKRSALPRIAGLRRRVIPEAYHHPHHPQHPAVGGRVKVRLSADNFALQLWDGGGPMPPALWRILPDFDGRVY